MGFCLQTCIISLNLIFHPVLSVFRIQDSCLCPELKRRLLAAELFPILLPLELPPCWHPTVWPRWGWKIHILNLPLYFNFNSAPYSFNILALLGVKYATTARSASVSINQLHPINKQWCPGSPCQEDHCKLSVNHDLSEHHPSSYVLFSSCCSGLSVCTSAETRSANHLQVSPHNPVRHLLLHLLLAC